MRALFGYRGRGGRLSTEVTSGLYLFLSMAYLVVVVPWMLSEVGVPLRAAVTACCLGAAALTLAMGLLFDRPLAFASGMGTTIAISVTLCGIMGVEWHMGMAVVFVEGVAMAILLCAGQAQRLKRAIPLALRRAACAGLGLMIALFALQSAGIVIIDGSFKEPLGSFDTMRAILGMVSLVIAIVLCSAKVPGALLWSIALSTVAAFAFGQARPFEGWDFSLDFMALGAPFLSLPKGGGDKDVMALLQVIEEPTLVLFAVVLFISEFSASEVAAAGIARPNEGPEGSLTADTTHPAGELQTTETEQVAGESQVAQAAQVSGEPRNAEGARISRGTKTEKAARTDDADDIELASGIAVAIGGAIGAGSIAVVPESDAGAAHKGTSGLASLVCSLCLLGCAFLTPIFTIVPDAAFCGALAVVGYRMMLPLKEVDWSDLPQGITAFLTVASVAVSQSLLVGLAFGFIAYCLGMSAQGRPKEVPPFAWILAVVFLVVLIYF